MIRAKEIPRQELSRLEDAHPRMFSLPPGARAVRFLAWTVFLSLLLFSLWRLDFSPARIIGGLKDLGWMFRLLFPPSHGGWFWDFMRGMGETLAMAFLGTLFGFVSAIPLGFLAARNVIRNTAVHFLLRRSFDVVRGINVLIWALMLVHVVGLGPFAGIMAITISDTATLAKLFSEAIENVDSKQIEGAESTGADLVQVVRYAYVPQVLPIMLSNALYFFESNVRSASILGVLGAGGIGMQLHDRIRVMNWNEVCYIVIMILITVAVIDMISKQLRIRIIANPAYRP